MSSRSACRTRTTEPRYRRNGATRVAVVDAPPVMQERIRLQFGDSPDWSVRFLEGSAADSKRLRRSADLLVLPAALMLAHPERFRALELPLVAYGPASQLSACFLAGCCDYLRTEFAMDELFHRLAALAPVPILVWRGFVVTLEPRAIRLEQTELPLRYAEYRILRTLLRNCGEVVTRAALYRSFAVRSLGSSRAVDMHVANVRRKLDRLVSTPSTSVARSPLETVRGIGYRLTNCG